MEAVLPQPVRPGYILVNWIGAHMLGDGAVERGVEVGDTSNIGDFASAVADDFQGCEVVSAPVSMNTRDWFYILDSGSYSGAKSSKSFKCPNVSSLISTGPL